jgi:acetyl/propionyl-CoA carboxylase alpha subunit
MKINKILIANRGEIAIRIHHTLKKMGIKTAGIFSKEDRDSYHRFILDECYDLGDGSLLDTYLNIEKIIEIAKKNHCDAIHPGYGFLSENYRFAERCEEEKLLFVGPSSNTIKLMGDKIRSKNIAKKLGIPVLENITGNTDDIINAIENKVLNFPLLVKASAGGGGKGMKILYNSSNLKEELIASQREAENYFGDGTIFVEKYIENPRHIEVQIMADKFGNCIHLFERECSIQRRHQKIIEEAPSPTLSQEERIKLFDYALRLAKEIEYTNAGTIEFLFEEETRNFYFLEMNTRIQVEHPVTEMITGIDIVNTQIQIALNMPMPYTQNQILLNGHAIEARVYAEDPENDFLPSPGKILTYIEPTISNIRIDSSIKFPQNISSNFDPMISKIIAWGKTREEARINLIHALENYVIHGVKTNIDYLIELLKTEDFKKNHISTNFCKHFRFPDNTMLLDQALISLILMQNQNVNLTQTNHKKYEIDVWQHIGRWSNV